MITVDDLQFTYPGKREPTLKGLSFAVSDGEIFGFLGPSGSGKSTTQKLLIGLLRGASGTIEVLGKAAAAWGPELYHDVGMGFELPNHFTQLTGRENLELFASMHGTATWNVNELLDRLGIADAADERVKNYSKGMAMRLNFARAVLHRPKLLFLDEPTAGLDPTNARVLKDLILELRAEGTTIFLTTHDMHDADELCDRVGFIVAGEIHAIDAPRALRLAHGTPTVVVDHGEGETDTFDLTGLGDSDRFREILAADRIHTLHSQEATLEDVFISVTGTELR